MIRYENTTVFNVGAQTVVNTVNCVGVMGAGLALEFKLRFPEMYEDYVEKCSKKEVVIGKPYIYKGADPWIMNFPTKNHWKYPSKLKWLQQGLEYFVKNYKEYDVKSIAFPRLGCERGGLNWHEVKDLMEEYLKDISIDVFICLDNEYNATRIEGLMVSMINERQNNFWLYELKIRDDIAKNIIESLPVNRFREVGQIEGVGKKTYEELFKLLYNRALKMPNLIKQNQIAESVQFLSQGPTLNIEKSDNRIEKIKRKENEKGKLKQMKLITKVSHFNLIC